MPKEEADLVGDLHYCWRKARRAAGEVQDRLATLQVGAGEGCLTGGAGGVGRRGA